MSGERITASEGLGLSAEEIARINAGLPDLSQWGPDLLVPFEVTRLARASVLWINRRWLIDRGISVHTHRLRSRVEHWLLSEFAFCTRVVGDLVAEFCNETRVVYCDRYGDSVGGLHGGSARTGLFGRFQVKGVGLTPLAHPNARFDDAPGWVGIDEAMREAAFSEVAWEEFPYRAHPVIAILDTGLRQHRHDYARTSERRALIVRSAILRLSHMERAILFRDRRCNSPYTHTVDVERTKGFIQRFAARAGADKETSLGLPTLETLAVRLAAQGAFGEVQRLYYGGMLSSNLSLDGALFDFGAMRALPSWAATVLRPWSRGFGADVTALAQAFQTTGFYWRKSLGPGYDADQFGRLQRTLVRAFRRFRRVYFGQICGLPRNMPKYSSAPLFAAVEHCYLAQQRVNARHDDSRPSNPTESGWFHRLSVPAGGSASGAHEHTLAEEIMTCLARGIRCLRPGREAGRCSCAALYQGTVARAFAPRTDLMRASLDRSFGELGLSAEESAAERQRKVSNTLVRLIGRSRRMWRRLPRHVVVKAQYCKFGTSVLHCISLPDWEPCIWVEGPVCGGIPYLFCRPLESALAPPDIGPRGAHWSRLYNYETLTQLATSRSRGARTLLWTSRHMQFQYPDARSDGIENESWRVTRSSIEDFCAFDEIGHACAEKP